VLEAIKTFAAQNHYDLIVSDGVLYVKESVDITDKILKNLQKLNQ
jgi:Skp family chaperone for outer membrane proteins